MRQGFSLLEMALVLIVIGIVAGLSMSVGTQQIKQQEVNKTYNELKIIDDALGRFVKRYGRMPCPTRNDIAATDPAFGREHAACAPTDAAPSGMVRVEYPAASGNFVRIGAVPFRALGLGADFASDEWKNRYLYAVNEHYIDDIGDAEVGSITVNDDNGNPISTEAVYVLTSFGLSGEGGIDNERIATDDACDATDRDGDNCDNDGVFVDAQFNDGNVVGSFFDDITLWRTRQRVLQDPATDMVDLGSSTGSGTGSGSGSTTTTTTTTSGSGSTTTTSGSGTTTTSGSGTTTTSGSGTTTTTSGSGTGSGSGSGGAACIFDLTNETKLTPSDGAAGDFFGTHTSGDGTRLVVGAFQGNGGRGSVYVFEYNGTNWVESQKLTASDAALNDRFGYRVAIEGDTIAIGAYYDDSIRGSVYIFEHNGTSWVQTQKLTASNRGGGDKFGTYVAISGDWIAIGAMDEDTRASNAGAVYMFNKVEGTWTETQMLTASNAGSADYFGQYFDIYGDTMMVAAMSEDSNGSDSGSVYVYTYDGTSWSQTQKLNPPDNAAGDMFGGAVSLYADLAFIGARGAGDVGASYAYRKTAGTWVLEQKIVSSDGVSNDYFGQIAPAQGNTMFTTAYLDDDNGTDSGSLYKFEFNGTSWVETEKITPSDGAAGDRFGNTVWISNGTTLVSSYLDDDNGTDSGSVYVFGEPQIGCGSTSGSGTTSGSTSGTSGTTSSTSGGPTTCQVYNHYNLDNDADEFNISLNIASSGASVYSQAWTSSDDYASGVSAPIDIMSSTDHTYTINAEDGPLDTLDGTLHYIGLSISNTTSASDKILWVYGPKSNSANQFTSESITFSLNNSCQINYYDCISNGYDGPTSGALSESSCWNYCSVYDYYNMDNDADEFNWRIKEGSTTLHSYAYTTSHDYDIDNGGPYQLEPNKNYTFELVGEDNTDGLDSSSDFISLTTGPYSTSSNRIATKTGTSTFSLCTKNFTLNSSCQYSGSDNMTCSGGYTPPATRCRSGTSRTLNGISYRDPHNDCTTCRYIGSYSRVDGGKTYVYFFTGGDPNRWNAGLSGSPDDYFISVVNTTAANDSSWPPSGYCSMPNDTGYTDDFQCPYASRPYRLKIDIKHSGRCCGVDRQIDLPSDCM